jgi:hypothetical protein
VPLCLNRYQVLRHLALDQIQRALRRHRLAGLAESGVAGLKSLNPLLDEHGVLQRVNVLGEPLDDLEALQNVHDVIDPAPLDTQRLQAIVQIDCSLLVLGAKEIEEFETQFP